MSDCLKKNPTEKLAETRVDLTFQALLVSAKIARELHVVRALLRFAKHKVPTRTVQAT